MCIYADDDDDYLKNKSKERKKNHVYFWIANKCVYFINKCKYYTNTQTENHENLLTTLAFQDLCKVIVSFGIKINERHKCEWDKTTTN